MYVEEHSTEHSMDSLSEGTDGAQTETDGVLTSSCSHNDFGLYNNACSTNSSVDTCDTTEPVKLCTDTNQNQSYDTFEGGLLYYFGDFTEEDTISLGSTSASSADIPTSTKNLNKRVSKKACKTTRPQYKPPCRQRYDFVARKAELASLFLTMRALKAEALACNRYACDFLMHFYNSESESVCDLIGLLSRIDVFAPSEWKLPKISSNGIDEFMSIKKAFVKALQKSLHSSTSLKITILDSNVDNDGYQNVRYSCSNIDPLYTKTITGMLRCSFIEGVIDFAIFSFNET